MAAPELPSTAKAAVITGPGTVEIREFPLTPPDPGWAVLRVLASGICGTDLRTFRGETRQYVGTPHERTISYPVICGHETVGTLVASGGEMTDAAGRRLRPGDRVVLGANVPCGRCAACRARLPYYACERLEDYGNSLGADRPPHLLGGWSEFMYVLPGSRLFRVPDGLPDRIAALAEPMAVTHGLERVEGGLAGATVYVLGCGPLGACHIVKARAMGAARVLVADLHAARLEIARRIGATDALLVSATSEEERLATIRDATDGRGVDVAVEASGSPAAFREGLRALRFGGTLIEVGAFVGSHLAEIDLAADVCLKDARVIGVGGEDDAAYGPTLSLLAARWVELGVAELVTHVLPLGRVGEALELAASGRAMKVQLAPDAA
ncbi:MAG TPA: zinc-binding dehydrogenase [Actinomycetota bacterium]|nr:zinc-binding dehydrogenase [Actinomycetota bacterium]